MKTSSLLQLYRGEMEKSGLTNDLLLTHLDLLGLIEDDALQKELAAGIDSLVCAA